MAGPAVFPATGHALLIALLTPVLHHFTVIDADFIQDFVMEAPSVRETVNAIFLIGLAVAMPWLMGIAGHLRRAMADVESGFARRRVRAAIK